MTTVTVGMCIPGTEQGRSLVSRVLELPVADSRRIEFRRHVLRSRCSGCKANHGDAVRVADGDPRGAQLAIMR